MFGLREAPGRSRRPGEKRKEEGMLRHKILAVLAVLAAVAFAAFNGSGPWGP
jgi:hypothetical protein